MWKCDDNISTMAWETRFLKYEFKHVYDVLFVMQNLWDRHLLKKHKRQLYEQFWNSDCSDIHSL